MERSSGKQLFANDHRRKGEKMSKLLINEQPLVVLPSLAKKIGLNEAIMLQQIHFWLTRKPHEKDGRQWIYNTYAEWATQFPFWSESTIKRTIRSLEKKGLIITGNFNKAKFDKTKWYTIDYDKLEDLSSPSGQNDLSTGQNDLSIGSEWSVETGQNEQTNTIEYPEINNIKDIYIREIYEHWNSKGIIKHRKMTAQMRSHINARLREYSLEELKKAIDNYATVLSDDKYYWTHKWTLHEFMKPNNVARFVDDAAPLDNFLDRSKRNRKSQSIWEVDF